MPKLAKTQSEFSMSPASQMSFAISACAFAAAGIGTVVNHWLTGWMAVGGMAGVGLFYLAIGILNLRSKNAFDDDESMASVSQRTARSDNLYAEAVSRPRIDPISKPESSASLKVNQDH